MHELVGCEPVEYSDAYQPSKYGIIFKEKVYISPTEATSMAMSIRLLKDGEDLSTKRDFIFQVLDNDKVIFEKEAGNTLTISHFLFRANVGLNDGPASEDEPDKEVKHNYVV